MNISLEHLELLPKLLQEIQALKLNQVSAPEKKWFNSRELSEYIGYSIDSINKMVKDGVFIDGLHYYKPSKKLLFDKEQINNWIVGLKSEEQQNKVNLAVENILQGIK